MIIEELAAAGFRLESPVFWVALIALGAAVFLFARAARLRARLDKARIDLARAKARAEDAEALERKLEEERNAVRNLENEAAVNATKLAERERALTELKARMETEFKASTAELLEGAHKAFLQRANETFERHREAQSADAEKRKKALDDLLKPVSETLVRYEKGLADMRAQQQKAQGELAGRIGELAKSAGDVRMEAQKLSTALRAGPKTRGRWGEEQLRNVVEIAGMSAHVDFVEQSSHDDGERRKQPDMIVRLPGGRMIAVDSKVSVNAYLDALDAEHDADRAAHFARHANDLWAHVKQLSARDYAESLRDSLDFVVMFVPGENYYAGAMEARPQLFQDAFEKKILIATPTTLIAILKSAAYYWRQENAAQNAERIMKMGKDLHDSLRVMGAHLTGLGNALGSAVKKYNDAVGGFERRVLARARRLADYELLGVEKPIEELTPVDEAPRALAGDKDMLAPPDDEEDSAA
ncbi:MAG: DNA recombination protein RmuC [Parvularculaceae bacterium]